MHHLPARLTLWLALLPVCLPGQNSQPTPPPPSPPPVKVYRRPPGRVDSIEVTRGDVSQKDAPETLLLIGKLRGFQGAIEPKSEAASGVLAVNEKLIPAWFNVKLDSLEASEVVQSDREGVLSARWRVSGPSGLTSVAVRDGSAESVFLFEYDAPPVLDAKQLLASLLRLRPSTILDSVIARQSSEMRTGELVMKGIGGVGQVQIEGLRHFGLAALLDNHLYVTVTIGKRLMGLAYPPGTGIATQRFPPMSQVAQGWTTPAILERLRDFRDPLDYFASDRDSLARELVRRHASDDDLLSAVQSGQARGVLNELAKRGGLAERISLLKRVLDESATGHCFSGRENCPFYVFRAALSSGVNLEQMALDFAATAKLPDSAFLYLGNVSRTPKTLEAIRRIHVSDPYALQFQDRAISEISRRIDGTSQLLQAPRSVK